MATQRTATFTLDGETLELPVLSGEMGPDVIDVRALYAKAGLFTFDPGFQSTAACTSAITYVDGEQGVLLYRGYPLDQLARECDFLEVCYLILKGELPNVEQKREWVETIQHHTMAHEQLSRLYTGFRRDAHPMAVMVGVIGALSAFYHNVMDFRDQSQRDISAQQLLAKFPTLVAMAYKYNVGHPFMRPRNELGYGANFLHMMFAVPCEPYVVNPVLARALERILIVHADHEQGASTSTVRLAGSSGANPFACVASGIACLWGPAHGGASERVLEMLDEIGDVSRIGRYIARARDTRDSLRLAGFGHRVYKSYDPRAKLMREVCHEVLGELGLQDDRQFKLALELERIALQDDYFVSKKLYPNVDFYSGIVLNALGIPRSMFTAVFAMARSVGWIAHWNEMISDPDQKIGRPRQLFTGSPRRDVPPMGKR